MSRLIILVLIGLATTAADAQEQIPQVLLVVREQVRPDSAKVYAKNESEIAGTCARLRCPHPYLALASLNGPREVWWLNVFESQQDKERVDRAWTSNRSLWRSCDLLVIGQGMRMPVVGIVIGLAVSLPVTA